jgi:glycosyltransferase involved in cell wall biosynthesis
VRRLLGEETDVALLPSVVAADGERDGIPLFLVEAMAVGLPVVTTAVAGIPELVVDGTNGVLVDAGDPNALVTRIEELLADAPRRARLGAAARETVLGRFDVRRAAAELLALIRGAGR